MSNVSIGWDETAPADSRNAGLGASDIRSILTNLRGGFAAEHVWPTSGPANAGSHKPGSALAFYGTASQVSSSDTDGRLMVTSDTSNLYLVNSATTVLVGGRFAIHAPVALVFASGSVVTSKVTQHWVVEAGTGVLVQGSSSTAVTYRTTFLSPPIVVGGGSAVSQVYMPNAAPGATSITFTNVLRSNGSVTNVATGDGYDVTYLAMGLAANG